MRRDRSEHSKYPDINSDFSRKRYLTPPEAVQEGYFSSLKQAATLRSQRKGPTFHKPNGGRVVYDRKDLETWIQRGRVLTSETNSGRFELI